MKNRILIWMLVLGICGWWNPGVSAEAEQKDAAEKTEDAKKKADLPYRNLSIFMESLELLREKYVDSGKVSYENLLRSAMRGMLQELDPFSTYEEPERFRSTVEDTRGKFPGIGVVVTSKNNALEIVSVMEDAPAMKAGLRAGDIIMEIDGKDARPLSLSECVRRMKGAPGTVLKLKIYRPEGDQTREISVTRAEIAMSSVKAVSMIADRIGYLRITQFSATTAADVEKAVKKLKSEGAEGLIVDLRNNPGGLLNSAVETISRFIPAEKLVVSVEGRAEKTVRHNSVDCWKDPDLPLAVLVNENSASAAEILAACLQDYKRAVLVGSRTFGKGSVQVIIPLSDGGALRITTAKYYTLSRRLIHGNGVQPDIEVNISPAQSAAVARHLAMRGGKPPLLQSGKYRDPQLARAIEILKGINIFRKAEKD